MIRQILLKFLFITILTLLLRVETYSQIRVEEPIAFQERLDKVYNTKAYKISYVPIPIIAAGLSIKRYDDSYRELRNEYIPSFDYHVDDYLQYAPAALMLGLKSFGVESRSSWGEMLTADIFSVVIMTAAVNGLKYTTSVMRPDSSSANSFPSGHTATAFMTATMLHREYGDVSPWYSVGGYTAAAITGLMRMSNNRHWLSDVMVGAGLGIWSTELGYIISDAIFKRKRVDNNLVGEEPSWYDYDRSVSFGVNTGVTRSFGPMVLPSGESLSVGRGGRMGFEGSYHFNPYVGVGGRVTLSNSILLVDDVPLAERLDVATYSLGGYFTYPFSSRWRIGLKSLLNYNRYKRCNIEAYDIAVVEGRHGGLGTGVSMEFLSNTHWAMRAYADYDISYIKGLPSTRFHHLVTCGFTGSAVF